jgi:hypothetical protein
MEGSTPRERIVGAVSRFKEDVVEYPYAKIWCVLWIVFGLVAFIGGVMLASEAHGSRDPTYRLAVVETDRITLPSFRFDIVSGTSTTFTTYACATQSGQIVPLKPCGPTNSPNQCLQTDGPSVYAMPTDNKMTCIMAGSNGDANFMVKVSSPGAPDYRLFTTYIHSTDGAVVYLDRVQFSSHSSKTLYYTLTSEYFSAAAQPGAVNIEFVVPTFETYNWIQWSPFSGWNAFGTMGGMIFFIYLLHSLVMLLVGAFFENPWRRAFRRSNELQPLVSSSGYKEIPEPSNSSSTYNNISDL